MLYKREGLVVSSLAELFTQTLECTLNRKGKIYCLKENKINYRFKTSSRNTFGGRIEWGKSGIFKESPPGGIMKMCDAFFVVSDKGKDQILLVEIKTKHKCDYSKQLYNTELLCKWLLSLFKYHKHHQDIKNIEYKRLLIISSNPGQPPKSPTGRVSVEEKKGCYIYRVCSEKPMVYLSDYLQK